MKQKSGGDFRVNVGGIRIDVPPLGPNPAGAQASQEAMRNEIRGHIEQLEEVGPQDLDRVGSENQKRLAQQQLEEARRALDKAILEKEKKPAAAAAGAAVQAQFILRVANEPANENLTLTRRNGRYVARLIESGVRITVTGPIQADPKAADAIVIEARDGDAQAMRTSPQRARRHRGRRWRGCWISHGGTIRVASGGRFCPPPGADGSAASFGRLLRVLGDDAHLGRHRR